MKRDKQMGQIIFKVAMILLMIYMVMMGIFTFIQKRNYTDIYAEKAGRLFEYSESIFIEEMQNATTHEQINGALANIANRIRFNSNARSDESFYTALAFFNKEGECIVRPGNMLSLAKESKGQGNEYGRVYYDTNRLVNLDEHMEQDDIRAFFNLIKGKVRTGEYRLEVEGYEKNEQVIPEWIKVYDVQWTEWDDNTREKIGEKLIQEYTFNLDSTEGLKHYKADYVMDNFETVPTNGEDVNDFRSYIMTDKTIERYEACSKQLLQEAEYVKMLEGIMIKGEGGFKSFFDRRVEVGYAKGLQVGGEPYIIDVQAHYYPWEPAIRTLFPVYLFSFIVILILGVLLSKGLIKIYKQQQLIEKNRRQLVDAIGHELKTPLGIIRMYTESMREKIAEEKREYYLDTVMDEVDKMNKMILEMIDLSKLESKAYSLKEEVSSIGAMIEGVIEDKKVLIGQKQIQLIIEVEEHVQVKWDYERMKQVFSNLLMNAICHVEQEGTIKIVFKDYVVRISNDGPMIPKDEIDLIWSAFYQGKQVLNTKILRGTGLGLSIVKHILELHQMPFGVHNGKEEVIFWFDISNRVQNHR